jgi:hypothetical protein
MKNLKEIKELHCGPFPPSYGGRTKLPIEAEIKPVYGRATIFSAPHACLAAGLIGEELSEGQVVNWEHLKELADTKWDHSVDRFLADAKTLGVNSKSQVGNGDALRGAIIGWTFSDTPISSLTVKEWGFCSDLDLTLAILSRRVGDIFIGAREPDLSWDTLFGSCFAVDEELGPAPDLLSEPWNRFKWW